MMMAFIAPKKHRPWLIAGFGALLTIGIALVLA
ncbi:hypothetical protein FHR23_000377 [Stakelama sediminis]|uniref:Uncharacterized protein n=1 Tax=Stakelama sediminis TaxID=463200 RepID=A0A840YV81_9SPHN|nr:hypothetical protein [Stakelama sediminis]